jgi:glycogen operon protein
VSYAERHNEANLEDNQDGHAHNLSHNHGHEGPTDNRTILASRRKQRLNLLATLLTSRGVPMLLAGDELGHSQQGNNNAYAQDNEIAWLDWSLLDNDPEFLSEVRGWIALRKAEPLLNTAGHAHGEPTAAGLPDIEWLAANGEPLTDAAWSGADAFALVLTAASAAGSFTRLAIAFNRAGSSCRFALPAHAASWQLVRATGAATLTDGAVELDAGSLAALKLDTRSG